MKNMLYTITLSGITTFIGAIIAFIVNWIKEKNTEKNKQKELLLVYFYNLNFAIRNVAIFINNVNVLQQFKKNNPLQNKNIPVSNIIFNFDEEKLSFICKESSLLYENIIQLKTEINTICNYVLEYNNHYQQEILNEINFTSLALCSKLVCTIKNIDKYLIKFYKKETSLIGNIKDNVNILDIYFENTIKNLKSNQTTRNPQQIKNLEEIKSGWHIDF